MPEHLGTFDDDAIRRIKDGQRRLEAMYWNLRRASVVTRRTSAPEQPQKFRNDSGETIPAMAVMRPTGIVTTTAPGQNPILTVESAVHDDTDLRESRPYFVNGNKAVADGATGTCSRTGILEALYFTGDGTPQVGETWGMLGNPTYKWMLRNGGTGRPGFRILGGATTEGVTTAEAGRVFVEAAPEPAHWARCSFDTTGNQTSATVTIPIRLSTGTGAGFNNSGFDNQKCEFNDTDDTLRLQPGGPIILVTWSAVIQIVSGGGGAATKVSVTAETSSTGGGSWSTSVVGWQGSTAQGSAVDGHAATVSGSWIFWRVGTAQQNWFRWRASRVAGSGTWNVETGHVSVVEIPV